MTYAIRPAAPSDTDAIAALQTESWRSAYRGLVPERLLDGSLLQNRLQFWRARLALPSDDRLTLAAISDGFLVGFTCVLRNEDPAWGPLLDNLHVRPDLKGRGIGSGLLHASREWSAAVAAGRPMHLWVIEGNSAARRFYDRRGGVVVEHRILEMTPGVHVPSLRYVWQPLARERDGASVPSGTIR